MSSVPGDLGRGTRPRHSCRHTDQEPENMPLAFRPRTALCVKSAAKSSYRTPRKGTTAMEKGKGSLDMCGKAKRRDLWAGDPARPADTASLGSSDA